MFYVHFRVQQLFTIKNILILLHVHYDLISEDMPKSLLFSWKQKHAKNATNSKYMFSIEQNIF